MKNDLSIQPGTSKKMQQGREAVRRFIQFSNRWKERKQRSSKYNSTVITNSILALAGHRQNGGWNAAMHPRYQLLKPVESQLKQAGFPARMH